MHKIIFLNGPPGSGKDTAGKIIRDAFVWDHKVRIYKMSRPLKAGLAEFFNIDPFTLKEIVEGNKDERVFQVFRSPPVDKILTWREVQMALAEAWAKPLFGDDILGRLAVKYLTQLTGTDMTVISDVGFRPEMLPIVEHFRAENCLLIKLERDGCSFEGDSRSYITLSDVDVETQWIDNRYPLQPTDDMPITFGMQLSKTLRMWLGEEQE